MAGPYTILVGEGLLPGGLAMAAKRGRPPKNKPVPAAAAGGGASGGEVPVGALAGLPAQKQSAVLALLEHTTIKNAAAAMGVTERTLYRWLAEEPFKRAFREARREAFGHSISLAQRYTPMAVGTLVKLAGDPKTPPAVRVSASMGIVKIGREGIELDELVGRVEGLEAAAAESAAAGDAERRRRP